MTDAVTRRNRDRDRLAVAGASDGAAFAYAGRHTGRVRVLRRGILIFCSVTVLLGAVIAIFDPFSRLKNISLGGVGLQGTKISIESPRLAGHRKDGLPYEVRAAKGIQDITKPDVIELVRLDAKVGMSPTTSIRVTANQGIYDSAKDEMQLTGLVRIRSDAGYDMKTESALIELKSGVLTSKEPVRVLLKAGSIDADTMQVIESGHVVFEGNIRSIMVPEDQRTETVGMLKGTAQ
jgi:lipopolysaccharide export system protein LptC